MVKDHSDSEREETRCRHMGYSFRLAARVLLCASSHRQDNTYHGLCYTSRGALAGTRQKCTVSTGKIALLKERKKEMFYLTVHSTHFIYDYMASYIMVNDY